MIINSAGFSFSKFRQRLKLPTMLFDTKIVEAAGVEPSSVFHFSVNNASFFIWYQLIIPFVPIKGSLKLTKTHYFDTKS
jgi:hypothetical protein